MFTIEDIKKDPRFFIDDFNTNRLFGDGALLGREYEVVFVKIGSILRSLDGKTTSLYDTDVYSFLLGTEKGKQKYKSYCDRCHASFRNEENYKKLIDEMLMHDYDITKGAIVIDENNFILDGQHRACITLFRYGPYHKVQVLKCFSGRRLGRKKRIELYYYKLLTGVQCFYESVRYFVVRIWKKNGNS